MNDHTRDWNVHGSYGDSLKDYFRRSGTIDEHIRSVLIAKIEEFDREVWRRARFLDGVVTKDPGEDLADVFGPAAQAAAWSGVDRRKPKKGSASAKAH